jgi:hypothetical protein
LQRLQDTEAKKQKRRSQSYSTAAKVETTDISAGKIDEK